MAEQESIASKTARTAFWSAIQKFSIMGIQFVVSMLLARLLDPKTFGSVALLNVFFAIAGSVTESGFSNALIRKTHCSQADYSTAFMYNMGTSIGIYLIFFVCAPFIADFYEMPVLCPVMRVSGLSLIFSAIGMTQSVQLVRALDMKTIALISFLASLGSGVVGVWTAYQGWGVWALVFSSVSCSAISSLALICLVRWKPSFTISHDSFKYLWGFGSNMLLAGIISNIYTNIYSIVIGKIYDARALGLFDRGNNLSLFFPKIINSIFAGNTLPIMSQIKDEKDRLKMIYRKYVILVSFLNVPLCLLMAALAKPFIIFFLTDKWIDAVIYLQLFCLSATLSSAGVINLNIFQVEGRSDITLKADVIKKSIGVMMIAALIPFGPLVLAIGSNIFNFFCYGVNLYYVHRIEHISIPEQMKDLAPTFISSTIAAIAAFAFTMMPLTTFLQLICGGMAGALTYYLMTRYIYKMDLYEQIFDFAKQKLHR